MINKELFSDEIAYKYIVKSFDMGYLIEIGVHPVIKIDRQDRDYFYSIKNLIGGHLVTSSVDNIIKSEAEAIFKAYEWIIKKESGCSE